MIALRYDDFIFTLFLLCEYVTSLSGGSKIERNATLTDFTKCKLTQFGTDYRGSIATTAGGIRCQMWHTEKPLHKISEAITDTDFPERSRQLARNYCRNPTKDPRGPWCYTMEPRLIDDDCDVPLCNFGECRISGTGSEYGGTHSTGVSGRKCKSWDKRFKLAINKTEKYPNNRFSDLSRNKAKNFCRNPDSSLGGPWCYVDAEDYDVVEKEYCSVPFCEDKDCLVYSKNSSAYSILTSLNSTIGNMTFWLKLWNPADEMTGWARLLFTHLQVPASAKAIAEDWGAGVEIVIANSGSGQEYPRTDDEADFEETPTILLGSKWTALWVSWGGGFISVGYQGSIKPIFLDEFKKKNKISSMYPESFFQYGIMGTGILWSTQFCEETCEVHTTFGNDFQRAWPLLISNSTHDIQLHVRASHSATIQLTQTPVESYPRLLIALGQQGAILVMYQQTETSVKEILLDMEAKSVLNFWAWQEFTISIFAMSIQMFWHRDYGREELFSVNHFSAQTVRWFSIGTDNTIGHWTLFCAPTEADAVESPWFPNCVSSSSSARYEGSQWTSGNQVPCVPWISDKIPKDYKKDDIFIDGSALKALNKCRNPTNDPEGPFCFTAVNPDASSVKKEYCSIRKCRSSECRLAGTANDYLGTLSVTRSGRHCIRWIQESAEITPSEKNISLSSIIARAFTSLKVKRENSLKNSLLDDLGERWDKIGLRSGVSREKRDTLTWLTPVQIISTEFNTTPVSSTDGNGLVELKPTSFLEKQPSKIGLVNDFMPHYRLGKLQLHEAAESSTLSSKYDDDDDDDDEEGIDLFKLKPATFSKKETTSSTSTSAKPDADRRPLYPGVVRPYRAPTPGTSESPDDDHYDDYNDNFYDYRDPHSSSQSPEEEEYFYDDHVYDKFKPTPTTTPKEVTTKSTSTSAEPDNNRPQYHSVSPSTSQSPADDHDNDNDEDDGDLFNFKPATLPKNQNTESTTPSPDKDDHETHHPSSTPHTSVRPHFVSRSPGPTDSSPEDESITMLPPIGNIPHDQPSPKLSNTTQHPESTNSSAPTPPGNNTSTTPKSIVDPRYLNDTLYPEQNARNASNFCRNPSRNIAGTWCYTDDPEVPQDLCNVRDCEQPEECIFLVRGQGVGRRLFVLPEYRSEGLRFFLKEWEPDHPDSITFVILGEDDIESRLILKVGAMKNEKVLLYYESKKQGTKLVKEKTLPHLLYLGKWTGFVIRMDRGGIKLSYEGAPYPLFEWKDPNSAQAFLPIYYYYSSELGNSIGVAFNCDTKCHIEHTTTDRFTRILPISIWLKEETPSPDRLVLMLRGEGVVLLPLLLLPTTPGYYALTIGEIGQWIYFMKNKLPAVHVLDKQDTGGPLFTSNSWTNITIQFRNYTIQVFRNDTEVFHYVHNAPLLFYFFSLAVDKGGWATWAANCIPTDIDGDPLDGGWSEWGPWSCSASCNGGMGVRKRICDNPEPNIRGQPCLGPSMSSGHCNMNKCGDVADVTLELIKKRIRIEHHSIIVKEGDRVTLSADADIVAALKNETPTSEINWSRNGILLEEQKDRIKIEDTSVSISYTLVEDSGVYTQTLHRVDDSHLIFKIITLAVIPIQNQIVIRKTSSFSITCHCVVLGYVYSDLRIAWILNGNVYKDYGVSTPVAVNVDYIRKVNASHSGEWRCEVVQSDLNFKWTTNVITVNVLGPPNWRTHLMEDKLTRPIFGWMPNETFVQFAAFFLTSLIIAAIVGSTVWYLRFRESLKWKDPQKEKLIDNDHGESMSESEGEKLLDVEKKTLK